MAEGTLIIWLAILTTIIAIQGILLLAFVRMVFGRIFGNSSLLTRLAVWAWQSEDPPGGNS